MVVSRQGASKVHWGLCEIESKTCHPMNLRFDRMNTVDRCAITPHTTPRELKFFVAV